MSAYGVDESVIDYRKVDQRYWRSVFTRYLMRPTSRLIEEVQAFLKRQENVNVLTQLKVPFLSLHVRYGDKFTESSVFPIRKYLDSIDHFSNISKMVFLSTETQRVIPTCEDWRPDVTWYYLNYSRLEINYGAKAWREDMV